MGKYRIVQRTIQKSDGTSYTDYLVQERWFFLFWSEPVFVINNDLSLSTSFKDFDSAMSYYIRVTTKNKRKIKTKVIHP